VNMPSSNPGTLSITQPGLPPVTGEAEMQAHIEWMQMNPNPDMNVSILVSLRYLKGSCAKIPIVVDALRYLS
jgi:hypothetical protein